MVKKKTRQPLGDYIDDEEDDEFWGDLEGDIVGAQKKAVELLAHPKGIAKYTLSELSSGEVKTLATLKSVAEIIPDPVLVNFIRNYVVMKRAVRRRGVKEIISIVGGRAWRILQNIQLSRLRRVHETGESEQW